MAMIISCDRQLRDANRGWGSRQTGRGALLLLLVGIGLLLSVAGVRAAPALWRFGDEDSTVYLFGTIHILRPQTRWRDARLDAVLERANHFVFELPEDRIDPLAAQKLVLKKGFLPADRTLAELLPPAVHERLLHTADRLGLPATALERMRPWYAALQITVETARQMGLQAQEGVDRVLAAYAKDRGVPIDGLETLEEQIDIFAGMPPQDEIAFLDSALVQAEQGKSLLLALEAAWTEGRLDDLAAILDRELEKYPRLLNRVLTARNRHWLDRIVKLLHRPGVHFVAVGSAHLVGPDNLITMLKERGIAVERLR